MYIKAIVRYIFEYNGFLNGLDLLNDMHVTRYKKQLT